MKITFSRTIDPPSMTVNVVVESSDVTKAFDEMQDPDEELFYKLLGPQWQKLGDAGKLSSLTQLAQTLDLAGTKAKTVEVKLNAPERK